jgi:hypothetical protein
MGSISDGSLFFVLRCGDARIAEIDIRLIEIAVRLFDLAFELPDLRRGLVDVLLYELGLVDLRLRLLRLPRRRLDSNWRSRAPTAWSPNRSSAAAARIPAAPGTIGRSPDAIGLRPATAGPGR